MEEIAAHIATYLKTGTESMNKFVIEKNSWKVDEFWKSSSDKKILSLQNVFKFCNIFKLLKNKMIEISTKPENIWNKEKKKHISIHSVTIQFIKYK